MPLPPREYRMGGKHFKDDAAFMEAAGRDVDKLVRWAGLQRTSRVLDWGCGAGRLAVGLRDRFGDSVEYLGVDVQPALVDWARANLATELMAFTRADVENERYNPDGIRRRRIPRDSGSVDVFHAYSVFSHMRPDDVVGYGREIARVLAASGAALVTAFVEPEVVSWEVNPDDYGPLKWRGPLHCVLYNVEFFRALMSEAGLDTEVVEHGTETDGQSLLRLRVTRPPTPE